MNDIINTALLALTKFYITAQIPFALTLDNHNNWDTVLPNRLKTENKFLLNMQNTDLKDSYIDTNGDIIITAGIDDIIYTKILEACDVHSIGLVGKIPIIVKSFSELPAQAVSHSKIQTDTKHSMECMCRNNPKLFKKEVKDES